MQKHEFREPFVGMLKALGIGMNPAQTEYFWDEFQGVDARDWRHACRELAFGKPGLMPKIDFIRDNVTAATEMRLHAEKHRDRRQAETWMDRAAERSRPTGDDGDEQYTRMYAACCVERIRNGLDGIEQTAQVVQGFIAEQPGFEAWLKNWRVRTSGELAYDWLLGQVGIERI